MKNDIPDRILSSPTTIMQWEQGHETGQTESEKMRTMVPYQVTYIQHSGFAVETEHAVLFFDCYQDPSDAIPGLLKKGKAVVFFVTHWHADHWGERIARQVYESDPTSRFVIDHDTVRKKRIDKWMDLQRLTVVKKGDRLNVSMIDSEPTSKTGRGPADGLFGTRGAVKALSVFGSNDEGVSYLLRTESGLIYHAGDLNNWDWKEDLSPFPEMERWYREELTDIRTDLDEAVVDLAFVPVDLRLQDRAFSGAEILLEYLTVTDLIPMHLNGGTDLPGQLQQRLDTAGIPTAVHRMTKPGQTWLPEA